MSPQSTAPSHPSLAEPFKQLTLDRDVKRSTSPQQSRPNRFEEKQQDVTMSDYRQDDQDARGRQEAEPEMEKQKEKGK